MARLTFFLMLSALALTQASTIRWMPLGDSITDYGCWRAWIWKWFQQEGSDVDIVGSQRAGEDCNGLAFDRDHEGHPGYRATDIAAQTCSWTGSSRIRPTLSRCISARSTSCRGCSPPAQVLEALGNLVDQMRQSNPAMRIIKNSTVSPIWVVDQWTNFFTSADLYDGIHPSASGDLKIAAKFYPALLGAIRSIQGKQ